VELGSDFFNMIFGDTIALTQRALKKWVRNPAAVLPGLFTAAFWLVLFGSSFNPTNLIPSQFGGALLPPEVITQIKSTILGQTFGGAPDYITYLVAGVISLIIVFNQAFGGIDIVLDKQLGYLDTVLVAPITRASIFFSGVAQNFVKAMVLAVVTFFVAMAIPDGLILGPGFSILTFLGVFSAFSLIAFGFSSIFTALAFVVKSIDSLVAIAQFVTLPLVFMSNAMFPSSSFPSWLLAVANVNPISKADEIVRLLIINGNNLTGSQVATVGWDSLYLGIFAAALGAISYLIARRALRAI
jgi:ABC-2 type transport system permease protein